MSSFEGSSKVGNSTENALSPLPHTGATQFLGLVISYLAPEHCLVRDESKVPIISIPENWVFMEAVLSRTTINQSIECSDAFFKQ